MMPRLGTCTPAIWVISLEMLCAWLLRFASAWASAPGVSMKVTIGVDRLADSAIQSAAAM